MLKLYEITLTPTQSASSLFRKRIATQAWLVLLSSPQKIWYMDWALTRHSNHCSLWKEDIHIRSSIRVIINNIIIDSNIKNIVRSSMVEKKKRDNSNWKFNPKQIYVFLILVSLLLSCRRHIVKEKGFPLIESLMFHDKWHGETSCDWMCV